MEPKRAQSPPGGEIKVHTTNDGSSSVNLSARFGFNEVSDDIKRGRDIMTDVDPKPQVVLSE